MQERDRWLSHLGLSLNAAHQGFSRPLHNVMDAREKPYRAMIKRLGVEITGIKGAILASQKWRRNVLQIEQMPRTMAIRIGITMSAILAAGAPALAGESGVQAGLLTCEVASGWGFVFGSTKDLKCTFSSRPGVAEHYTGTISKFGVDIGYSGATVIAWTVIAPSNDVSSGALAGTYAGAAGSAAVGGGVGANVLVGGGSKSITLQPVSFQAGTGLNVAGGIATIDLVPAS